MYGIYVNDPSKTVVERLRAFPKLKELLDPPDLAALESIFAGSIHPDPVKAFLDFFSGLDSASEGEFAMADSVAEFGAESKWREMMRQGCESQVTSWLAALFGAFNADPPTESSPVAVLVIDDDSVNPPEFLDAGIFRRDVVMNRTSPTMLTIPITFYINRTPEL